MKIYNERYEVEFSEKGGEITKFLDKDTNIQYMYQGDSEYWSGKNPTLFPIVGNTYDTTYETKGKTYTFKNHGLIRYATLDCIENKEDTITFELKANEDTLKSYPYEFIYQIKYILKNNKLDIVYTIKNDDKDTMPFTFGLHPGFRVPLEVNEVFEDYKLEFEHEEEMQQLIFNGNNEKPHYFEDIKLKYIPMDYKLMDKYLTLIYKGYKSSYVTLKGKNNHGVKVSISGYPLLALWSPKERAPFLCVEPWYSHGDFEKVNVPFEKRIGMMQLEPSNIFTTSYSIEIF